ncbi:MAG: hypothetical protein ACYDCQ_00715 [Dehalococcoidia bacterium]
MTGTAARQEPMFGDLNGPLAYWGPAAELMPAAMFSPEEQALLLRLRRRIETTGRTEMTDAFDALLSRPGIADATA